MKGTYDGVTLVTSTQGNKTMKTTFMVSQLHSCIRPWHLISLPLCEREQRSLFVVPMQKEPKME